MSKQKIIEKIVELLTKIDDKERLKQALDIIKLLYNQHLIHR